MHLELDWLDWLLPGNLSQILLCFKYAHNEPLGIRLPQVSDSGWWSPSAPGFHSYLFVQFASLYNTYRDPLSSQPSLTLVSGYLASSFWHQWGTRHACGPHTHKTKFKQLNFKNQDKNPIIFSKSGTHVAQVDLQLIM